MGPNPTPEGVRTGRKRQHTQGGRKRVGFPPCWGLPSVRTGGTGPDFDSLGGGVGTYSDSDRFSPLSPEHALPPPTNRPLLGRRDSVSRGDEALQLVLSPRSSFPTLFGCLRVAYVKLRQRHAATDLRPSPEPDVKDHHQ